MGTLRLLHLEDSPTDAFLVRNALAEAGIGVEIIHAATRAEFTHRVRAGGLDAVLVDSGLPDISSREAIAISRAHHPATPIYVVSNSASPKQVNDTLSAGAAEYILKGHWWQLISALRRASNSTIPAAAPAGLTRLVAAVHELSVARDIPAIMAATRHAARELTHADAATFAVREGDECYFADEEAPTPLWKGQRYPLRGCVSGWAMERRQPLACEDISADPDCPAESRDGLPVRGLLVVPIRPDAPVGAIGAYWRAAHLSTASEVELLQTLANTAAVAMENVHVYEDLERRVRNRTLQLEAANQELEAFSYSVAHDLRGPLHAVAGYADLFGIKLEESLDEEARSFLGEIHGAVDRMTSLIDDLLRLARIGRAALAAEEIDLSAAAEELLRRLALKDPSRDVAIRVAPGLRARGDEGMLRIVLENLLSNAWKYTSRRKDAEIEVGALAPRDGHPVFFVRDNGAGFDPQLAEKLFAPFQRLHRQEEFEGTGVGLATVQRIIHRHGGLIWAEGEVDRGATFMFSLPDGDPA